MVNAKDQWFETIDRGDGKEIRHVSKFLRKDFSVLVEFVKAKWPSWTPGERIQFAGAFAARSRIDRNDRQVLEFLMQNGEPRVWTAIALLLPQLPERRRAVDFLLARVADDGPPLANYYQALELLSDARSTPVLMQALQRHEEDVRSRPSLKSWSDRFSYMDYLSCSATLFKITRKEEYRLKVQEMFQHPDESIRKMAQLIAKTSRLSPRP